MEKELLREVPNKSEIWNFYIAKKPQTASAVLADVGAYWAQISDYKK